MRYKNDGTGELVDAHIFSPSDFDVDQFIKTHDISKHGDSYAIEVNGKWSPLKQYDFIVYTWKKEKIIADKDLFIQNFTKVE